ncbi:hypothetical protein V9W64_10640 [Neisseria leonii]|uniref:Uncharacterized protein n=1 Tax=Neisseria leonii TaxID=2995413 RepID=A0A9X4E337_9NEIS|nr:hypothetical protein [Neisseria sp. 51.81]MDD9328791.1 hypothetical protein [Neisseria sp. 51.81]
MNREIFAKARACEWVMGSHPLITRDEPPTDEEWAAWFDSVLAGTADLDATDEDGYPVYCLTEMWSGAFMTETALTECYELVMYALEKTETAA